MTFKITYDQIPESEDVDLFETIEEVIDFAIRMLSGTYYIDMSFSDLEKELINNGYFISKR